MIAVFSFIFAGKIKHYLSQLNVATNLRYSILEFSCRMHISRISYIKTHTMYVDQLKLKKKYH